MAGRCNADEGLETGAWHWRPGQKPGHGTSSHAGCRDIAGNHQRIAFVCLDRGYRPREGDSFPKVAKIEGRVHHGLLAGQMKNVRVCFGIEDTQRTAHHSVLVFERILRVCIMSFTTAVEVGSFDTSNPAPSHRSAVGFPCKPTIHQLSFARAMAFCHILLGTGTVVAAGIGPGFWSHREEAGSRSDVAAANRMCANRNSRPEHFKKCSVQNSRRCDVRTVCYLRWLRCARCSDDSDADSGAN